MRSMRGYAVEKALSWLGLDWPTTCIWEDYNDDNDYVESGCVHDYNDDDEIGCVHVGFVGIDAGVGVDE